MKCSQKRNVALRTHLADDGLNEIHRLTLHALKLHSFDLRDVYTHVKLKLS